MTLAVLLFIYVIITGSLVFCDNLWVIMEVLISMTRCDAIRVPFRDVTSCSPVGK
jgi:hypothetical protein